MDTSAVFNGGDAGILLRKTWSTNDGGVLSFMAFAGQADRLRCLIAAASQAAASY